MRSVIQCTIKLKHHLKSRLNAISYILRYEIDSWKSSVLLVYHLDSYTTKKYFLFYLYHCSIRCTKKLNIRLFLLTLCHWTIYCHISLWLFTVQKITCGKYLSYLINAKIWTEFWDWQVKEEKGSVMISNNYASVSFFMCNQIPYNIIQNTPK
jgi:hypothetical protein